MVSSKIKEYWDWEEAIGILKFDRNLLNISIRSSIILSISGNKILGWLENSIDSSLKPIHRLKSSKVF